MLNKRTLNSVFIFLLVGFSLNFFEPKFISENFIKYTRFVVLLFTIILSIPELLKAKGEGSNWPIRIICISIIVSIYMASITWGQSLIDSFKATVPFAIWFIYFYLLKSKPTINSLEKIIIIYGIIYIVLFLFQFINNHTVYFGFREEFIEDRGIIRIDFPGGGIFFLTSFIAINKLTSDNRLKQFWLILAVLGLLVTILQVTRQNIAAIIIIYLFHFLRQQKLYIKVTIVIAFFTTINLVLHSNNPIVNGLLETQEKTREQGSENIRLIAGEYFLNDFSQNNINRIFGNGIPWATSDYGRYELRLRDDGFYFADVGLIAFYTFFGVFALLALIFILIRNIFLPLPSQFTYLKYYLWYIVITSLTSSSPFHYFFLISTVFVLYAYQMIEYERKRVINQMVSQVLIDDSK